MVIWVSSTLLVRKCGRASLRELAESVENALECQWSAACVSFLWLGSCILTGIYCSCLAWQAHTLESRRKYSTPWWQFMLYPLVLCSDLNLASQGGFPAGEIMSKYALDEDSGWCASSFLLKISELECWLLNKAHMGLVVGINLQGARCCWVS